MHYWMPTTGDRVYCVVPKATGTIYKAVEMNFATLSQQGDPVPGWVVIYDDQKARRSNVFPWTEQTSVLILPERPRGSC